MIKDKVLRRILTGGSDANIRFEDLLQLLRNLGFVEAITFLERKVLRKRSICNGAAATQNLIRFARCGQ
jgi:hypothetical protein